MVNSTTSGRSWAIRSDHRSGQVSHSGFCSRLRPLYRYGPPRTTPQPIVVRSRKLMPGVGGRYRMIVQAIESPNTATVCGRGPAWAGGAGRTVSTKAAADTSGTGPAPVRVACGTTTIVTATAVAAIAPASRSTGTCTGCQRRTGCSISHQDSAAAPNVAAQRAANSG